MGGSYAACYPLAADLAEAGLTAVMLGTAELLHFRAGILGPTTPVIAVSQSGESAEIVRLATGSGSRRRAPDRGRHQRDGQHAGSGGGSGARHAGRRRDESIDDDVRGGPRRARGDRKVLRGATPEAAFESLSREAERAAGSIERFLANPSLGDGLLAWLGPREDVVVLGRGPARAAAEMAALTLKEAVGLPAEAVETAQFRHGPLELAGPNLAAILIATEPETESSTGRSRGSFAASVPPCSVTRGRRRLRDRRDRPLDRAGRLDRADPAPRAPLAVARGSDPELRACGEGDDRDDVSEPRPRVALTFDAEHPDRPGASAGTVDRILATLRAAEAPATFFVQGRWSQAEPSSARRIADDGHLVGNHSHYHARDDPALRRGHPRGRGGGGRRGDRGHRPADRTLVPMPFGDGHDDPRVLDLLARASATATSTGTWCWRTGSRGEPPTTSHGMRSTASDVTETEPWFCCIRGRTRRRTRWPIDRRRPCGRRIGPRSARRAPRGLLP